MRHELMDIFTPKRTLFAALALTTIAAFIIHNLPMFGAASPEIAHIAPFRWWLLLHAPFGILALLLGPLQFSSTIRRKNLQLHRRIGQAYVIAVCIASVSAMVIGFREEWGVTQPVVQAVAWLVITLTAWIAARSRNVTQHRMWVARSYGLSFVFVTSRLVPDLFFPTANNWALNDIWWTLLVAGLVVPDLLVTGNALLTAKRGAA
jgi:uncharacterized membrane protein